MIAVCSSLNRSATGSLVFSLGAGTCLFFASSLDNCTFIWKGEDDFSRVECGKSLFFLN